MKRGLRILALAAALGVGAVGRGWVTGDPAIEIIRHDPRATPFEMHHIAVTKDGFAIHFTAPLGPRAPAAPDVAITEFHYEYWATYGSERFREALVPVSNVQLSADRTILTFRLPRKAGFIYELQLPELVSQSGLTLVNNFAYYTLNQSHHEAHFTFMVPARFGFRPRRYRPRRRRHHARAALCTQRPEVHPHDRGGTARRIQLRVRRLELHSHVGLVGRVS